jgi:hypothetical protein
MTTATENQARPQTEDELQTFFEQNLYGIIHKVIREYPDILAGIIRYEYPEFDLMGIINQTDPKVKKDIVAELSQKYPGQDLFELDIPYVGLYILRRETLEDAKAASDETFKYSEDMIKENGGRDAISKLPQDKRERIALEIDAKAKERANEISLKRCVVYPENFAEMFDANTIAYGVYPTLLEKLTDISGFARVEVKRI